jgi:hypothetical protein
MSQKKLLFSVCFPGLDPEVLEQLISPLQQELEDRCEALAYNLELDDYIVSAQIETD